MVKGLIQSSLRPLLAPEAIRVDDGIQIPAFIFVGVEIGAPLPLLGHRDHDFGHGGSSVVPAILAGGADATSAPVRDASWRNLKFLTSVLAGNIPCQSQGRPPSPRRWRTEIGSRVPLNLIRLIPAEGGTAGNPAAAFSEKMRTRKGRHEQANPQRRADQRPDYARQPSRLAQDLSLRRAVPRSAAFGRRAAGPALRHIRSVYGR